MRGHRYKVGEAVRVRSFEWYQKRAHHSGVIFDTDTDYRGKIMFTPNMAKYCGKIFTISEIRIQGGYIFEDKENRYAYIDWMLQPPFYRHETPEYNVIKFLANFIRKNDDRI